MGKDNCRNLQMLAEVEAEAAERQCLWKSFDTATNYNQGADCALSSATSPHVADSMM